MDCVIHGANKFTGTTAMQCREHKRNARELPVAIDLQSLENASDSDSRSELHVSSAFEDWPPSGYVGPPKGLGYWNLLGTFHTEVPHGT
jgi:hypothetical protein